MLHDHADFEIIGEAENGTQVVALAAELCPDVILMDLRMPETDGIQATVQIREQQPASGVLILTTYNNEQDMLRAFQAGAAGYLLKDAPPDEIRAAIRSVARGETVLNGPVAQQLIRSIQHPPSENTLSEREIEILEWVAKGKTNQEIGQELFISTSTVKTHLIHIFDKLGVNDRTAAVTVALERRILHLPE